VLEIVARRVSGGDDGDLRWPDDTMRAKRSTPFSAALKRAIMSSANDGRSPDDLNDPDPLRRVDYVCSVGSVLYAFEHTGIEPFGNQIELEVHNQKLFGPVTERFDHRADREFWEFHVPVGASAGLVGGQVNRVQDALIKWIEANAARFPVTRLYDRYANPALGETASPAEGGAPAISAPAGGKAFPLTSRLSLSAYSRLSGNARGLAAGVGQARQECHRPLRYFTFDIIAAGIRFLKRQTPMELGPQSSFHLRAA